MLVILIIKINSIVSSLQELVLSSSLQNFSQIILYNCYPQSRKGRKVIQVTPVQLQEKLLEATEKGKSCI